MGTILIRVCKFNIFQTNRRHVSSFTSVFNFFFPLEREKQVLFGWRIQAFRSGGITSACYNIYITVCRKRGGKA